jgi:hypothetical protein
LFWPSHLDNDRGRELERQWKTLDRSFSSLLAGEAEGWRPHIVLSPMLVEMGRPLLISNLDLSRLNEIEFFRVFPELQSRFRLATAVRLNATFPAISPAVELPTLPPARAVDAGYYDNYGVGIASGYLTLPNMRPWVKKCTSGVMLIQIRAFKSDTVIGENIETPVGSLADGFAWLTAPLEGVLAARDSTNLNHNDRAVDSLKTTLSRDFFQSVIFEAETENVTMTWSLSDRELEELRNDLGTEHNKEAMAQLKRFWLGAS